MTCFNDLSVMLTLLDSDVPSSDSCGIYSSRHSSSDFCGIYSSRHCRFCRVCSHTTREINILLIVLPTLSMDFQN